MQYDTAVLSMPTVKSEMDAFPALRLWVQEQGGTPGSRLHGLVDPERMVIAGHSRGGKLAALLFAGESTRSPPSCRSPRLALLLRTMRGLQACHPAQEPWASHDHGLACVQRTLP